MSSNADKKNIQEYASERHDVGIRFPTDHSLGELWIHDAANQPLEDLDPDLILSQSEKHLRELLAVATDPEIVGLRHIDKCCI